jgi:uncharacterized protein
MSGSFSSVPAPRRSLLSPPSGPVDGLKEIFWNPVELRAGWRLVIYIVLFAAFAGAGGFVILRLRLPPITAAGFTAYSLFVQELMSMLAAMCAAGVLARLEGRTFGTYGLPAAASFRLRFWQGIAWGLAMIAAIIFLIRIFGGFSLGPLALHGKTLVIDAALWALAFLCVGFFEEFLFRGYTQFTLASGIGFWPAATVISALFGGLHLGNRGEGPVGGLSVFVIGMFFCFTLRRTGNLWFAVGMHASFDWGETYLFSVPNSGFVASGHLLDSSFHGPAWLTGGTIGPEGSVMAFVVVAITAVIFSRMVPPREEP